MIPDEDLKIEIINSQEGLGQKVARNYYIVKITHIPTGITASSGYQTSIHKNKKICIEMIEAALTSTLINYTLT